MNTIHPDEQQLQDHVLNEEKDTSLVAHHLLQCAACREKVKGYEAVFSAIKQIEVPAFDVDMIGLVMTRLPQRKQSWPWGLILLLIVVLAAALAFIVYFRDMLYQIFHSYSAWSVALMVFSSIVLLIFQSLAMYRNYRKQLNELNILY